MIPARHIEVNARALRGKRALLGGATRLRLLFSKQTANLGFRNFFTRIRPARLSSLTSTRADVSLALYSGITIDGVVGLTYGIHYSADLSNKNGWQGMANVTLGAPTQLWFDLQPANQLQRYYRVVPGRISIP